MIPAPFPPPEGGHSASWMGMGVQTGSESHPHMSSSGELTPCCTDGNCSSHEELTPYILLVSNNYSRNEPDHLTKPSVGPFAPDTQRRQRCPVPG